MNRKTIAFVNVKGGSGKTISVINVGAYLSSKGYRVLLIDTDPLSSLTTAVLGANNKPDYSLINVLNNERTAKEVIVNQNKYDIISSDLSLSNIDNNLIDGEKKLSHLRKAIKDLNYDFILIDTPSNSGMMLRYSIYAADTLLLPLEVNQTGVQDYEKILDVYKNIKRTINSISNIRGIFFTNKNNEIKLSDLARDLAKKAFGNRLLKTHIKYDPKAYESFSNNEDIFTYDPSATSAVDYANLTLEIIQKIK